MKTSIVVSLICTALCAHTARAAMTAQLIPAPGLTGNAATSTSGLGLYIGALMSINGPVDIVINGTFLPGDRIGLPLGFSGSNQIINRTQDVWGFADFEVGYGSGSQFVASTPGDGLEIGTISGWGVTFGSNDNDGHTIRDSEDHARFTGMVASTVVGPFVPNEFSGHLILSGYIVPPPGDSTFTLRITPNVPAPTAATVLLAASGVVFARRRARGRHDSEVGPARLTLPYRDG